MKKTFLFPIVLVAALLAGCGGGSSASLKKDDVAVVGKVHVTKVAYAALIGQAQRSFKQQGRAFPKQGTTEYETVKSQAITLLVQQAERESKADSMGIKISTSDVDKRLAQIKKQYFGGKDSSYQKQLKSQGLTEPQLRLDLHAQILSEKLYNAVTGKIKVSDAEIAKYYTTNKSQYGTAASRDVRHILVNSKKLADSIETQLKNGGNFAALAKKYSKDPGSAKLGGKLTITKGQTVAPFDKVAFSLKTNETSPPVHTQYGWHIIQALTAVKPAKVTPLASVKSQISQQLLQTKRTAAMTAWLNGVKKDFAKKISYQAGYTPAATATATTTTATATTP